MNKPRTNNFAYAILILGTVFYAANHVIGRGVHMEIPPVGLSFWRWCVGALILLPFVWRDLRSSIDIIRMNISALAFLGFTMLGSTTFILVALNYTSAINVSLVNTTQPIMTVLLAWLFVRDSLVTSQVLGLISGTLGVLIMISRADWVMLTHLQLDSGALLAMLAVLGFSIYAINIRKISLDLSASVALFVIIVSGCVFLLPFYVAETILFRSVPFNTTSVAAIVALALIISVLGMLIWNEGNRIIGPAKAGMFINLIPVFTVLLAIFFLNEELYFYHFAGAVLISSGIFMVLRK